MWFLVSLQSGSAALPEVGGEIHCFLVPSTFPHCDTQAPVPTRQDEQGLGCQVARCTDCMQSPPLRI